MAVYQIVKNGDPVLRQKAKMVPNINESIVKLLKNMADTMYANEGVGLAAPQIGVSKRVIVVDVGDGLFEFVNPVIVESSGEQIGAEGCLSLPNLVGEVKRAKKVVVKALDKNGEEIVIEANDYLARAFQHEIDHLDGRLFIDLAKNVEKG